MPVKVLEMYVSVGIRRVCVCAGPWQPKSDKAQETLPLERPSPHNND